MRLLLVNSNTSPEVTAAIAAEAGHAAAPGTEIVPVNARFGPRVVATRVETMIAAHGFMDALAEHAPGADSVLLGMSFDTGVWAARELAAIPVLGMLEAALATALMTGTRAGLVTVGPRAVPLYRETVEAYGLDRRVVGIEALAMSAPEIIAEPERARKLILEAVERLATEGAEAVAFGGAAFAGLPRALNPQSPVPLVDGIAAGVVLLEGLVRLGLPKARAGSLAPIPPRESLGLGAQLTRALATGGIPR